jgi:uncharacterized membrane protein YgcG
MLSQRRGLYLMPAPIMEFPKVARFWFICRRTCVASAALVLLTDSAYAQSEPTRDTSSVGPAMTSAASDGRPATVNVPLSAGDGPPIQYLNDRPPPSPSANDALGSIGPSPEGSEPAPVQPDPNAYKDTDPSALNAFRSELDPYGRWIDDPNYGRVWVPDSSYAGADFAPYVSNGQWGLDADNNWIWMSDYPFGSVVFHYGRWVQVDAMGWAWVPGLSYAPAWVVWRVPINGYAYLGWAPAPPTYGWFGTGLSWFVYNRPLPFVFCPSRYVFYPHFGSQLVRDRLFANTLVHNSVWHSTAPVYGRSYSSPSIARARVPAGAVPSQRVAAQPRVMATSRSTAGAGIASRPMGSNPNFGYAAPRGNARNLVSSFGVRPATPSYVIGNGRTAAWSPMRSTAVGGYPRGVGDRSAKMAQFPASHLPSRPVITLGSQSFAHYTSPRNSVPSAGSMSSRFAAPTQPFASTRPSAPISAYLPPRFSAPGRPFSTPSYAPPSFNAAPRFSAPSRSYSAPASTFSAPSHSFSSGSSFSSGGFRSSGGGFRGGGGGFRGGGGGRRR